MRFLLVLSLVLLALLAGVRHLERTRPQDLPWTPLDLQAPIGLATGYKLQRLKEDAAACHAALARADIGFSAMPERRDGECGYIDSVVLERSHLRYTPTPVRLSCPLAAALAVWERRVVAPQARQLLGSEPKAIRHYGTYSCRRLYGRESGSWSEHATANAIDIAGFTMADGRTISILRDWDRPDASGAFLRAVHDGGCRLFGSVLGPDYNAAHRDHFHIDMRGWQSCR